jgi:hypothetical protein
MFSLSAGRFLSLATAFSTVFTLRSVHLHSTSRLDLVISDYLLNSLSTVNYLHMYLVLWFLGLEHKLLMFLSTSHTMALSKCSNNLGQSLTLKWSKFYLINFL